MIIILADDQGITVGKRIEKNLKDRGIEVTYVSISDLNVKPCYNCGYCMTKEYGKCAVKDDMQTLLKTMIKAEKLVLVTPVTFGSYSFQAKAVMDRSCVIGDPHYFYAKGELVKGRKAKKGVLYRDKLFAAVGVKNDCEEEEKNVFLNLAAQNSKIMNVPGAAFVISDGECEDKIKQIAEVIGR